MIPTATCADARAVTEMEIVRPESSVASVVAL